MNLEEKIKQLEEENRRLREELGVETKARRGAQEAAIVAQRLGIAYKNETDEVYRLLDEAHNIMQRRASEIFGDKPAEKVMPITNG